MKKTTKALLSISIILLFLFACSFAAHADMSEPEILTEKSGHYGTTPREAANEISLFSEIPAELVAVSNEIYQNIVSHDPELFLLKDEGICKISGFKDMTLDQLEYVRAKASDITKDCTTQSQKINAVMTYIAKNICYDNDYINTGYIEYKDLNHNAYDVLTNETAVCLGYSSATNALLQCLDVPCINIYAPNHAWNMAFDGESWILLDTTWISFSVYENGVKTKSDRINTEWYDFDMTQANSQINHVINDADLSIHGNGIYSFPVFTRKQSYTIPSSIEHFGDFVFQNTNGIKIYYNGKPKTIGIQSFYLSGLDASLDFSLLTSIKQNGLCDSPGLKGTVNLKSISQMADAAFCRCEGVESVIIGDELAAIPRMAFYECKNLKKLQIGKNLQTITSFAFQFCPLLKNVYYLGSSQDWDKMKIEANNVSFPSKSGALLDHKDSISVTFDSTAKLCTVTYNGIPLNQRVFLSEYNNEALMTLQSAQADDVVTFSLESPLTTRIKLMVLESLASCKPSVKAHTMNT